MPTDRTAPAPHRLAHEPSPPPEAPPSKFVAPKAPLTAPRLALVGYVTNEADVLARFAVTRPAARIETIDDDQLLGALRDAGLPAGMVRQPHRVTLAFHAAGETDRTP